MRGHHHLTDRQWISYMGERNERAARIRKLRRPSVRYAARLVLAFNVIVFAFCLYLVIR
jgi:hypothetical protein